MSDLDTADLGDNHGHNPERDVSVRAVLERQLAGLQRRLLTTHPESARFGSLQRQIVETQDAIARAPN